MRRDEKRNAQFRPCAQLDIRNSIVELNAYRAKGDIGATAPFPVLRRASPVLPRLTNPGRTVGCCRNRPHQFHLLLKLLDRPIDLGGHPTLASPRLESQ